ncbi:uncharacterized protein LOC111293359 [Durio zibethinus]|uniref:Uncharacterized protein LOC111293359 n=1 Tax=Durio zibethinus TaxID=66656 RepID=A0A6P5YMU7_DURZI|nr:uncharacterized protein LOC111293359 [Durio zibethinus]
MVGKERKKAFREITDKLRGRIQHWSGRMLSKGGKEVYMKAVSQATPMYVMSGFLLPKGLVMKLIAYLADFGGVRRLIEEAFIGCSGRRCVKAKPVVGWVLEICFMEADLGVNPSLTWQSVWAARKVLEMGLRWRVGDGTKIRIWNDTWAKSGQRLESCRDMVLGARYERGSELIDHNNRRRKE